MMVARLAAILAGCVTLLALCLIVGAAWAADNVAGNLINFDNDGMWSWYMDERVIVDPTNGKILIGSNSSSPVRYPTGRPTGSADIFTYDVATGDRTKFQLNDIQEDDHNAPGLMILPDGRYLAMYSNHGNAFGLGDEWTRWRVSTNPHDSSSWAAEQQLSWHDDVPGPDINVSYHNLHYLSAEDRIYNFSRGTNQAPNILLYDPDDNSATWAGQLADSSTGGYSTGYFKYASNGVNRIYFTHTETHPRDFNTSIYSGYVQNGQTFKMDGTMLDSNLFDSEDIGGSVPDVTQFTPVQLAGASGTAGNFRLWTVDMELASDGNPTAMYVSRYYNSGPGSGGQTTPIDHRIHYARWDGSAWHTYQIAQMGDRLYSGTDISEQDYTGNGALVPGNKDVVYISTQYDPREFDPNSPKTTPDTPFREIYKGVTADGGQSWTWTPITENSTVSNVRPLVPKWDQDHTAVVWMRGTYTTAQITDLAIVGVIEQNETTTGLVHYVDATASNTTRFDGSALGATGPGAGAGATDGLWHQRTGFGNGGNVLTADETSNESVPAIKTTLTGLVDGTYDIFAFVWLSPANDWRIQVGFDTDEMMLVRDNGAQQAEAGQFDASVTLSGDLVAGGGDDVFLYRHYVGRKEVSGGSSIDVFIDDLISSGTSGANRSWYDGLGYALVTDALGTDGDLNDDGFVDDQDIDILWNVIRPEVAGSDDPGVNDDEDLNGDGFVNEDDVDYMLANLLTAGPDRQYGDADLDGGVGGLDYTAWRQRAGTGWANGDFDGDGGVGGLDYTLWRTRPTEYPGTVGPHAGSIAAVPEPATLLLLGIGLPALAVVARRRRGSR